MNPRLRHDLWLEPYFAKLDQRAESVKRRAQELQGDAPSLSDFASGHEYFGLHRDGQRRIFREWAPNAQKITLYGSFCDWRIDKGIPLVRKEHGTWEASFPKKKLCHGDLYRLHMEWPGGSGERLPAWTRRVIQDEESKIFNAQVWDSPAYKWKNDTPTINEPILIYESHVGIAQEEGKVGSYDEFRRFTLPRVIDAGYNTLQLMAIMEHPYYGSFGYHVGSFFAASSRFGPPEDLKRLVDEAHGAGLLVIMDIVHSHAVKNEVEGLSRFDGTSYQYFHEGAKGYHELWDSMCFDYGKPEVIHFLLSNCRYWIDEFHFDGYRFDGVTSMLYQHHGMNTSFSSYDDYFNDSVDEDAFTYLALANQIIHEVHPKAITIAEDVSGMPGLASEVKEGGCGFDFRLAMGVPDNWFKLANDVRDEDWNMDSLFHQLTDRRAEEKTISYVESHDQALVGGKTFIFELIDADMYHAMSRHSESHKIDRGIALHKMARLATLATCQGGYLNFMGNEFGHPEWIDFPREGNNWSFHYARRQWSLRDNTDLRYFGLAEFDKEIMHQIGKSPLFQGHPEKLYSHVNDQILVISRGPFLFLFNFHPAQSWTDRAIPVGGRSYQGLLDTDESRFDGHSRLVPHQRYQSSGDGNISVYLPSRCATVLQLED